MARSKSSGRWLQEHHSDHFVREARREGYRSRAAYKLLEIQQKDRIFRRGMRVVDLGAAPGGWTQVASELIGETGTVLASDILEMDPLPDVTFIQGDFTEASVEQALKDALQGHAVDLVISDMAPNMSGVASVDQPKSMYLVELAHEFAAHMLEPGGALLVKVFQGVGFQDFLADVRRNFGSVKTRKPQASRNRSREQYLLCQNFRGA